MSGGGRPQQYSPDNPFAPKPATDTGLTGAYSPDNPFAPQAVATAEPEPIKLKPVVVSTPALPAREPKPLPSLPVEETPPIFGDVASHRIRGVYRRLAETREQGAPGVAEKFAPPEPTPATPAPAIAVKGLPKGTPMPAKRPYYDIESPIDFERFKRDYAKAYQSGSVTPDMDETLDQFYRRNPTIVGEFARGVRRGLESQFPSTTGATLQTVGETMQANIPRNAWAEVAGRVADAVEQSGEKLRMYGEKHPGPQAGEVARLRGIQKELVQGAGITGEGVASSASSFAGGVVGGAIGGIPGAFIGAALPAAAMNMGDVRDELERNGIRDPEVVRSLTYSLGTLVSLPDVIAPIDMARRILGRAATHEITEHIVIAALKDMAITGVEEATTEGAQEATQYYGTRVPAGLPTKWDEAVQRATQAAVMGGLTGVVMGGAGAAATGAVTEAEPGALPPSRIIPKKEPARPVSTKPTKQQKVEAAAKPYSPENPFAAPEEKRPGATTKVEMVDREEAARREVESAEQRRKGRLVSRPVKQVTEDEEAIAAKPEEAQAAQPTPTEGGPRAYPTGKTEYTKEEQRTRDVAQRLTEGRPGAIDYAAQEMAKRVPKGAVLVPVPNHEGKTDANKELANAIATYAGEGATVHDVLTRETPTESSVLRRRAGKPGLTAEEQAASISSTRRLPEKVAGRPVFLVDNVETTGATAHGARVALGRHDAQNLVFAKSPIPKGEKAVTAEQTKKEVERRAELAKNRYAKLGDVGEVLMQLADEQQRLEAEDKKAMGYWTAAHDMPVGDKSGSGIPNGFTMSAGRGQRQYKFTSKRIEQLEERLRQLGVHDDDIQAARLDRDAAIELAARFGKLPEDADTSFDVDELEALPFEHVEGAKHERERPASRPEQRRSPTVAEGGESQRATQPTERAVEKPEHRPSLHAPREAGAEETAPRAGAEKPRLKAPGSKSGWKSEQTLDTTALSDEELAQRFDELEEQIDVLKGEQVANTNAARGRGLQRQLNALNAERELVGNAIDNRAEKRQASETPRLRAPQGKAAEGIRDDDTVEGKSDGEVQAILDRARAQHDEATFELKKDLSAQKHATWTTRKIEAERRIDHAKAELAKRAGGEVESPKLEVSDNDGTPDLIIIPCGSKKQTADPKYRADHLYIGQYFKAALRYARSIAPDENIRILSAKYGLLRLHELVAPYDRKMGDPNTVSVEEIKSNLRSAGVTKKAKSDVRVLGGKDYVNLIAQAFPGAKRVLPEGLGIGEQLSAIAKLTEKGAQDVEAEIEQGEPTTEAVPTIKVTANVPRHPNDTREIERQAREYMQKHPGTTAPARDEEEQANDRQLREAAEHVREASQPARQLGAGRYVPEGVDVTAAARDPDVTPFDTPLIKAARRYTAEHGQTADIETPEREAIRDKAVEKNGADIRMRAVRDYGELGHTHQMALVLGLPGSGKTTIAVRPLAKFLSAAISDIDEVKALLDEFEQGWGSEVVYQEAGKLITQRVRDQLEADGANYVQPGVGTNTQDYLRILDDLREQGYRVHLVFVDVPSDVAKQRAVDRFEQGGHFIRPEYIDFVGRKHRDTYEALRQHLAIASVAEIDNSGDKPRVVYDQNAKWLEGTELASGAGRGAGTEREAAAVEGEADEEVAPHLAFVPKVEAFDEAPLRKQIRELKKKEFKTRGDEIRLNLLRAKLDADASKWEPGDGVGYYAGPATGKKLGSQINRGFRVVRVDAADKTALIRQVGDTGLTTTGGHHDRIAEQWVDVEYLVRDRKYDAAEREPDDSPVDRLADARRAVDAAQRELDEWRAQKGGRAVEFRLEKKLRGAQFHLKNLERDAANGPGESHEAVELRQEITHLQQLIKSRRISRTDSVAQHLGATEKTREYNTTRVGVPNLILTDADVARIREMLATRERQLVKAQKGEAIARGEQPKPVIQTTLEEGSTGASEADVKKLVDAALHMLQVGAFKNAGSKEFRAFGARILGRPYESRTWTMDDVYDAIEGAVNEYAQDTLQVVVQGVTLHESVMDALKQAREIEERFFHNRARSEAMASRGQFSTPLPIARAAQLAAGVRKGENVLEPTAGTGNLVIWLGLPGVKIDVNEIDPRRVAVLKALGFEPTSKDALRLPLSGKKYNAIVMNPPFGSAGAGKYSGFGATPFKSSDISVRFLAQALSMLVDGGRLVAIMPANVLSAEASGFREWLRINHTPIAYIASPKGSYASRGTPTTQTVMLVVDKGKPTGRLQPAPLVVSGEDLTWDEWEQQVARFAEGGDLARGETGRGEAVAGKPIATEQPRLTAPAAKPQADLFDRAAQPTTVQGEGEAAHGAGTESQRRTNRLVAPGSRAEPGGSEQPRTAPGATGERGGSAESGAQRPPRLVAPARPGQPGEAVGGGAEGVVPEIPRGRLESREGNTARHAAEVAAANDSPVFTPYTLGIADRRNPHPRLVVETRAMAGMPAPPITTKVKSQLVDRAWGRSGAQGGISDEQMDAVQRALTAWDNEHGFLASDDVGVGKTREAAALILEAIERGEKRILYTTKNEVNVSDAMKEFRLVASGSEDGAFPAKFVFVGDYKNVKAGTEALPMPDGPTVYFAHSYNFAPFVAALKEVKPTVWIADEAHEFKNLWAGRGIAWRALHDQMLRANAKFAYFTATPAVTLDELGYLYGLKEWPIGGFGDWVEWKLGKKPKPEASDEAATVAAAEASGADVREMGDRSEAIANAKEDDQLIEKGKKKFMRGGNDAFAMRVTPAETEQVMRELKGSGKYIARDLWRGGVKFEVSEIDMLGDTKEAKAARTRYNQAAELSRDISLASRKFGRMNKEKKTAGLDRALIQSYLKQLLFTLRLPTVLKAADAALARGEQVVISVHSVTGDADVEEGLSETDAETPVNERLRSAINRINTRAVEKVGEGAEAYFEDLGDIPESLIARAELLDRLKALEPLPDPVRAIEEHFGAKSVAVITGKRSAKLRKASMGEFQRGVRSVALISKAGKIGISLHDVNGKPRWMGIADYEWSADTFKQELGRVDRTGQRSHPKLTLFASNLAGERKFAATIAARMSSLGATSKGSAESTGTDALDQFDVSDSISLTSMRATVETMDNDLRDYFTGSKFLEWTKLGRGKEELQPKRQPDKAGMKDFLLDLLMFPVEASQRVWQDWVATRESIRSAQSEQAAAARRTGRETGTVLRRTKLTVAGDPPLSMIELKLDSGEKRAVLQGFVTPYMNEIQQARGVDENGMTKTRRYVHVTTDKGELVSGLELMPGESWHVKALFGQGARKTMTPGEAWDDLQAGDRIAVNGANGDRWVIHRRKDGRIQIAGATIAKHRDVLQGYARYETVGNYLYVADDRAAVEKFLTRFPPRLKEEGGGPKLGDVMSELRTGAGKAGMGVNKQRLADAMSANVYSGGLAQVIVKEAVQNAIDALRPMNGGAIDITIDEKKHQITVLDTGTGMTPEVATGAFLDAFESEKPEGSTGGLGIAKVALFRYAKPFRMETVAEVETPRRTGVLRNPFAPKKKKIKTTIEGSGDDWVNGTLRITEEEVPADTPTATGYFINIDVSLITKEQAGFFGAHSFVRELQRNSRLDNVKIRYRKSAASPWESVVPSKIPDKPAASVAIPGGTADIFLGDEQRVSFGGYTTVNLLNSGYYQFHETMQFGPKAPEVWVDIRPNVPVTDPAYPFTIDRSKLKQVTEKAIEAELKKFGKDREAENVDDLVRSLANAPEIKGGGRVYDTSGIVPRGHVLRIAQRPYAAKLAAWWARAGTAIVEAVQKVHKIDEPAFDGIGLGGDYLALNLLRSKLFERAKELGVSIGADARNMILVNPFNIVLEAQVLKPELATDPEHLADQTWGAIVHEIAHQNARGHDDDFSGEYTRIDGRAARIQPPHLAALDDLWRELLADTDFQQDVDALRTIYKSHEERFRGFTAHADIEHEQTSESVSGGAERGAREGSDILSRARIGEGGPGAGASGEESLRERADRRAEESRRRGSTVRGADEGRRGGNRLENPYFAAVARWWDAKDAGWRRRLIVWHNEVYPESEEPFGRADEPFANLPEKMQDWVGYARERFRHEPDEVPRLKTPGRRERERAQGEHQKQMRDLDRLSDAVGRVADVVEQEYQGVLEEERKFFYPPLRLLSAADPLTATWLLARRVLQGLKGEKSEPLVTSSIEDVEKRWQQSKGVQPESIRQKARNAIDAAKKLTRHFPEISPSRSPLEATAHELLLEHERAPRWAQAVAYDRIASVTDGLKPNEVDLLTRMLVLPDILKDVEEGLYRGADELPFGYKKASEIEADLDRYRTELLKPERQRIRQALTKRANFVKQLTRELVDADLLPASVLKDDRYYHRQVMAYFNADEKGAFVGATKGKEVRPRLRGFQRTRAGGGDFNTRYVEAEYEWVAQALTELKTKSALEEIDQLANRVPDLKKLARQLNLNLLGVKLAEAEGLDPEMEGPFLADKALAPFRQQIAIGTADVLDALAKADAGEESLGIDGFDDIIHTLGGGYADWHAEHAEMDKEERQRHAPFSANHPRWWSLLAALVKSGGPGSRGAAQIFKGIRGRDEFVKTTLGRDFVNPKPLTRGDYERLLTLAGDGYVLWQPEKGNHFFRAQTVDQRAMEAVLNGDRTLSEDDRREILAMGGAKETWVVPDWLAATLTHFGIEPQATGPLGALDRALQSVTAVWKQYILHAPQRVGKYNLNNLSGDADAALAYAPAIFRYADAAARDLWHYTFRRTAAEGMSRQQLDAQMEELIERGIIDAGLTATEIPDINDLPAFRRLAEDDPQTFMQFLLSLGPKYFAKTRQLTQYRENILRLAAYRYFTERVKSGAQNIYAASSPARVAAVRNDPKKLAALLARDLIGDYGAVSSFTAVTRKRAFPFLSFQEVNFKRYMRLFGNVAREGEPKAAARLTGVLSLKLARTGARLAKRAFLVNMFFVAAALWNHLFFPDEERELRRRGRNQLHLILGRNDDGSINSIRIEGAFADFLEWFGLQDYIEDVHDLMAGDATVADKAIETVRAPINKIIQLWEPFTKGLVEAIYKKSSYPDAFRPLPVRDRTEHVLRIIALDRLYMKVTGKPIPPGNPIARLFVYRTDPGEAAYFDSRARVNKWLDKKGKSKPGGESTEKSDALYYYKRAIQWNDEKAAERWRKRYFELGGSMRGMLQSIKLGAPLGALKISDRRRFKRDLRKEELDVLKMAEEWYQRVYGNGRRLRAPTPAAPAPEPQQPARLRIPAGM